MDENSQPAIDKRRARARHRTKLIVTSLTTYAYAIMLGALLEPLVKKTPYGNWSLYGVLVALALHGLAVYLAPEGEKND